MTAPIDRISRPIYVLPVEDAESVSRITLSGIAFYLWEARKWLAVFAVLGLSAGIAVDLMQSKWYHAQTLLAAAQADRNAGSLLSGLGSQLGGLASLAGINLNTGNSNRTEALTVLQSPGFLGDFIKRHDLMPVLFSKIWDPQTKSWKVSDPKKIPTLADTVDYFRRRILTVADDQKTGVITVSVEWKDRFLAAQWANILISELNETLRRRQIKESSDSIAYLNTVLRKSDVPEAMRQAVYNLIEAQMASQTVANVRKQFAFKVLDSAIPPDDDKFVRPDLLTLTLGGTFLSMIFGLGLRAVAAERFLRWWKARRFAPGHRERMAQSHY